MATYPEGNPGVYPLNPTTPVGRFRVLYGDVESEPYDPEEPGFQNYTEVSDAEIEEFLALGEGSVSRGIGYYYLRLAGDAAKKAKTVKDYDLTVDATKRPEALRAAALMWFERADAEGLGPVDAFEIVPTGERWSPYHKEAAPWRMDW